MAGISITDAARELGIPRTTLQEWVKKGLVETRKGLITKRGMDQAQQLAGERAEQQEDQDENGDLRHQLLRAQVRERKAIGKLREIELAHESGRFVELAQVQRAGADAAQRMLGVIRAMPQRIALAVDAALAAPPDRRAAAVEKIVAVEVERVVGELRRSLYLQVDPT